MADPTSAPAASPNRRDIPALDHVRGALALLVLFYHGFQLLAAQLAGGPAGPPQVVWIRTRDPLLALLVEGHTAVGGFITLSGFILVQGTLGRGIRFGGFLGNRALRILPLYGLLQLVALSANWPHLTPEALLQAVLPVSNFQMAPAHPLVIVGWAVSIEVQCYLLFPFLLRLIEREGRWFVPRLLLVLVLLRLGAVLMGANARDIGYWTIAGRLDQFVIGMGVGASFARGGGPRARWWIVPAAAALVGGVHAFHRLGGWPAQATWKVAWPDIEALLWAGVILAWVPASRLLPAVVARALRGLGRISFSVYLLNFPLIALMNARGWVPAPFARPYDSALLDTALILLPATLLLAALTHATVEAPFMRLRRRYTRDDGG